MTVDARAVLAGTVVDVGGLAVGLGASTPRHAEAVASLLRHARPAAGPTACRLELRPDPVPLPDAAPTVVVPHAALWFAEPATLWVRSADGLTAHATPDTVTVGGDVAFLAREFRFVCLLALTHTLARHGRYLLHAAAVVIDGGAVLALGETGTGKSTLAFAAHRLGWPVLADDAVVLSRAGDVVVAGGLPRPLSVPEDVLAGEVVARGRPVPDDPRRRTELGPESLAGTRHAVTGVLVTAGADPRGAGWERLGGTEVLRAVLRASIALADPTVRPDLLALAGALARLPAWTFRRGDDATTALAGAARGLEGVRAALRQSDPDRRS